MKISVLRRKLKFRVERVAERSRSKVPLIFWSLSLLVVVVLLFCVVELSIVSILSPAGRVLRELDTEKDILVEENRILEQEIGERTALSVVTSRAQNELNMTRVDKVTYLEAPSVSAEAPVH